MRSEVARALEMSESISGEFSIRAGADFTPRLWISLWNFCAAAHYLAGLHRVLAQRAPIERQVTLIGRRILSDRLFCVLRGGVGRLRGLACRGARLVQPQIARSALIEGNLGALLASGSLATEPVGRIVCSRMGAARTCCWLWRLRSGLAVALTAQHSVQRVNARLAAFSISLGQPGDAIRAGLLAEALGFAARRFNWLPAWTSATPSPGSQQRCGTIAPAACLRGPVRWFSSIDRAAVNHSQRPCSAWRMGLGSNRAAGDRRDLAPDAPQRSPRPRSAVLWRIRRATGLEPRSIRIGDAVGRSKWDGPFCPGNLAFPAAICLGCSARARPSVEFHCAPPWAAVGVSRWHRRSALRRARPRQPAATNVRDGVDSLRTGRKRGARRAAGWAYPGGCTRGMQAPSTSDVSLARLTTPHRR